MPYSTKKGTGKDKGKTCVHKKSSKKKVGCTDGPVEKYLTALRMAESDDMGWIHSAGQNKILTINKLKELFKKNNIDVDWDIEYDRTEDGHGEYNEYFGKFYYDIPETTFMKNRSYFVELYEKENGQLFFYLYRYDEEDDKYHRDVLYSEFETSSKNPEKFWRTVGWLVLYQMGKIKPSSGEETFNVENTIEESDELEWMKGPISFSWGEIKHDIHNYVITGDTIYLLGSLQLDEDDDWERLELNNEPCIVKRVRGEGPSRRVDISFGKNITNLPLWYNNMGHDNLDLGTLDSDDDIAITIPNKNINESNELEWIKNLDTYYKVEQLEVGKTYEFVPDYSIMDNEGFDDIPNWVSSYLGQKFYILRQNPKSRFPKLGEITFKRIGLSNKMVYDGIYHTVAYTARVFLWGKFKEVENPEFVMESNSLDWIENTTPKFTAELLEPGQKFYNKWGDVTRVLEYIGKDEENICYEPPCTLLKFRKIKDPSGYHPYQGVPVDDPLNTDMIFNPSEFDDYIDTGKLTPIFGDLNESEGLDWIKDIEVKGFEKNKSYVVDIRHVKPYTPMYVSPTSEEYAKLTRADVLNKLKWVGYNIDEIPINDADYLYIEPNDNAGYWDDSVWVGQTHWVDYDMEHNTPDPTYNGKYEIMDIDNLMFLLDNNLISESTDFDWIKEAPLTMNTCEAYNILNPGDEITIDAIDNWGDNPNQWDDEDMVGDDLQTFYNVKAKVLALDECSNIHRNNESNAKTILVSIEEDGYYGFDDLWADDFVGTLPKQCQKDNCMFLICEASEPEYVITLSEPHLNESTDFDWTDVVPSDYYPPDLESGLKGLEKWVGQAYQTDDEIGLSVQDVKENPNKENIQDLINVLKHWKPYHDGDEVYWAVEDLISSINPERFKDLNNLPLSESYEFDWVKGTGLGKIDLRDCKPGDILVTRSGKTVEYVGPTEKGHYYDHLVKYNDGHSYGTRTHDGYVFRKNRRDDDEDIIYVLKEHKKTITEAAGISFEARKWGEIIYNEMINNPNEKKRLIIDGYDHPEAFDGFPIDYVVIDFYDKLTGYGQEHSGYDKDGNYVVLLYVQPKLLQGQGGYSLKSVLNHEMKHAWDDYNRLSKGLPSIDNTKETKELYNKDFILMLSDQNVQGPIKEILKYYYYLSKLETTAYLENVYDENPVYEKIVREIASKDFEPFKEKFDLDINWHLMNTAYDIPLLKKFKSPKEFIDYSSEELRSRAIKMIKKINKMKYVHGKL